MAVALWSLWELCYKTKHMYDLQKYAEHGKYSDHE